MYERMRLALLRFGNGDSASSSPTVVLLLVDPAELFGGDELNGDIVPGPQMLLPNGLNGFTEFIDPARDRLAAPVAVAVVVWLDSGELAVIVGNGSGIDWSGGEAVRPLGFCPTADLLDGGLSKTMSEPLGLTSARLPRWASGGVFVSRRGASRDGSRDGSVPARARRGTEDFRLSGDVRAAQIELWSSASRAIMG